MYGVFSRSLFTTILIKLQKLMDILFTNLIKTWAVFQIKVIKYSIKDSIFTASFSRALLPSPRTQETQVVISEFTLVTKITCMYRRTLNISEAIAQAKQAREEHLHNLNKLLLLRTMETRDPRAGHRVNSDALIVWGFSAMNSAMNSLSTLLNVVSDHMMWGV